MGNASSTRKAVVSPLPVFGSDALECLAAASAAICGRQRREPKPVAFGAWHATDISWPPCEEGQLLTSRATSEINANFLRSHGVHVNEGVDVFDLLTYLEKQGVEPREVALCVFNCAHGRNYRADSDARHALMKEFGWSSSTFRGAAFQAMCAQLPDATCILTGRCWELVSAPLAHRRILIAPLRYGAQSGPQYLPEPSTRGNRREGELGPSDTLVATVAIGAVLADQVLCAEVVDVPHLARVASHRDGVVLFLGEFTLASARHCAQYALENCDTALPLSSTVAMLPEEARKHRSGGIYNYSQCLQYAREKEEPHPELLAANLWLQMWRVKTMQTGG